VVQITVSVPDDRQAEFYKMFGAWLERATSAEQGGWRNGSPWTAQDTAAAEDFYRAISANARRILDVWARSSGSWVSATDTAQAVGVNGPKGVAGSLSSVGKVANKMSRALPFEHEPGDDGGPGRYRMSAVVAELFRTVHEEVGQ